MPDSDREKVAACIAGLDRLYEQSQGEPLPPLEMGDQLVFRLQHTVPRRTARKKAARLLEDLADVVMKHRVPRPVYRTLAETFDELGVKPTPSVSRAIRAEKSLLFSLDSFCYEDYKIQGPGRYASFAMRFQ